MSRLACVTDGAGNEAGNRNAGPATRIHSIRIFASICQDKGQGTAQCIGLAVILLSQIALQQCICLHYTTPVFCIKYR
jgi:hypothetical protein